MMLGSGIMALADYLDLPEIYQSYGDTNVDRLTNPDLYKDAARVPANAFLDTMTFLGDVATDVPAMAADYVQAIKDGEDLTLLSDQGRDLAAATISGFTGFPSLTEDNPLMDFQNTKNNLLRDSQLTINSKYQSELQNLEQEALKFADETIPSFNTFATNNPNKTIADYRDMYDDIYNKKADEIYFSTLEPKITAERNALASQSSINQYGYDIFSDDQSISGLFGPGFRAMTMGNVAGTDIPLKYASEGEYFLPFMEYEGPEKEKLERLTFAAEVAGGLGSLARSGIQRFARNTDKISPELNDVIREYMRD